MIVPGETDITIFQNAHWDMPVAWIVDEDPYDFTDQTVQMQIRPTYESGTILAELTTDNGAITITDGGTGLLFELTAAQTLAIPTGRYVYDVRVVNMGRPVRMLRGKCHVDPAVTR